MKLSVIILSKNIENLLPCVAAVRKHEPDAEIIVVDDGLSWGSLPSDLPDLLHRDVRLVFGEKPFVYARNVNIGIREAYRHPVEIDITRHNDVGPRLLPDGNPDGVVLLNDDALLQSPGGFTILAKAAAENPKYGLIGGTTNVTGNRNQKPRGVGLREEPRMVTFLCVYIPGSTLSRCGLLDERYVGYGCDDDDYSFTVRAAGLQLAVHDGCYVDHGSLKSSFRGDPGTPADFRPNLRLFVDKWGHDNWGRPVA